MHDLWEVRSYKIRQMFLKQILAKDQASPRIPIIGILLPVPSGIRFRAPVRLHSERHSNIESSWAQHSSQQIYVTHLRMPVARRPSCDRKKKERTRDS